MLTEGEYVINANAARKIGVPTLEKINREMPGCSISVQAPVSSFLSLEENGFILDPNGIRVMGYKL